MNATEAETLLVHEAQDILRLSSHSVYGFIWAGKLRAHRQPNVITQPIWIINADDVYAMARERERAYARKKLEARTRIALAPLDGRCPYCDDEPCGVYDLERVCVQCGRQDGVGATVFRFADELLCHACAMEQERGLHECI